MPTNLLLILNNMAQVQNEQHSQIKEILHTVRIIREQLRCAGQARTPQRYS